MYDNLSPQRKYALRNKDKVKAWRKAWNQANPDYQKEWREKSGWTSKKYFDKNPKKALVALAKTRAKKIGLDFSINEDDFEIPEVCPLLGIQLVRGKGKLIDSSPTIDRIDNTRGYTLDNILIVSYKANRLKGDASLEELELLVKNLKEIINVR